jgi:hypothetical protein
MQTLVELQPTDSPAGVFTENTSRLLVVVGLDELARQSLDGARLRKSTA